MDEKEEQLDSEYVCPGQRLGHIEDNIPGEGTYIRKHYIYASLTGYKHLHFEETDAQSSSPDTPSKSTTDHQQKIRISIQKEQQHSIVVPEIHSIVTARITKVNPRFASVVILCVHNKPLKEPFLGIIRVQDVRATEQDKVEIYKCFRPGDIVQCEVISLGDSRSYFLSTAKNELGVIFAKSVAGATMIPISWDTMQCPKTKMKEFRKVAKVN